MPWKETNPVQQREMFIRLWLKNGHTMTELCDMFDVPRKTGYKWRDRFLEEGWEGLKDRSRAPKSCPHKTPEPIEALIVAEKARHPNWGAPKLMNVLRKRHPELQLPSDTAAGGILQRHGLTNDRRRRHRAKHPGAPVRKPAAPNELWTADFKGQFKTADGVYCYPLTVCDLHSRFLLGCRGLPSVKTDGTKRVFTRLFKEFGLPDAIRTDNGAPFCSSNAIHGLCELNVWWMRLEIHHERTQPSSPQQNGAHERMHRTLKRDTTKPPGASMRGQQRKFDSFRAEYNNERPHEALDGRTPAELYGPSHREFPSKLPEPDYPAHLLIRKVSKSGTFRINNLQPFLSNALCELYIGLEEVDDGLWAIYFYNNLLAHFDERSSTYVDS